MPYPHPPTISIHVLRVEDDSREVKHYATDFISIHVLRVEDDTLTIASDTGSQAISIHVLRVEDDGTHAAGFRCGLDFNPRPPCGGRRLRADAVQGLEHISIHVLRVEDDGLSCRVVRLPEISIHVLRVEDDPRRHHTRRL